VTDRVHIEQSSEEWTVPRPIFHGRGHPGDWTRHNCASSATYIAWTWTVLRYIAVAGRAASNMCGNCATPASEQMSPCERAAGGSRVSRGRTGDGVSPNSDDNICVDSVQTTVFAAALRGAARPASDPVCTAHDDSSNTSYSLSLSLSLCVCLHVCVLSCWPDGLQLTAEFYTVSNEQHRLV